MPPVSAKWATISPLHVGRGPEHQVFFPLVIELVLVDRGRGQEQHPERAGPGGTGGRVHLAERGPPERPAGIAADRQAGDDFDQLPRQVEDHWVVGLEDQVAWAGGVQNRLEVVAGGGQPGVEKSPAHRTEVFRVGHRPASPVIEEVEEPFAHVKDGLRLQAGDGDGITNRRSIDGPTRCPGGRRIGRLDPEGQGGHRDAPRGDADAFSAATGGRSSTSASSKTIGADRPARSKPRAISSDSQAADFEWVGWANIDRYFAHRIQRHSHIAGTVPVRFRRRRPRTLWPRSTSRAGRCSPRPRGGLLSARCEPPRRRAWRAAAGRATGWGWKCGYPDLDIQLTTLYFVARKKDVRHTADRFEHSGGRGRRSVGPIAPDSFSRAEVVRPSRF